MNLEKITDMVNLDTTDTGIPGYVRISSKFANHNVPRLRYRVDDEEISVSITESPKVVAPKELKGVIPSKFEGIVEWISLNKDLLIEYWNYCCPVKLFKFKEIG